MMLALDLENVGVLGDRPKRRASVGLHPDDGRVAPHGREERLQALFVRVRLWIPDLAEVRGGHPAQPITAFTSRNSSNPCSPHSRPLPDCL